MSPSCKSIVVLSISLVLVSCSRPKRICRDELRSELLAAVSLASETEIFIAQLQEGRVTSAFAKGHLAYLGEESSRSAEELREGQTDQTIAVALESGRAQLDSLTGLLADLEKKSDDKQSLSASRQHVVKIRSILEHAKDEL